MTDYSLDTRACLAVINGTPSTLRTMVAEALGEGSVLYVSSIVLHELWFGVAASGRPEDPQRLQAFLAGPIQVLPFDDADARAAGELRARLRSADASLGALDTMLAGQALRRGLTVVTADSDAYADVDALAWEDWAT